MTNPAPMKWADLPQGPWSWFGNSSDLYLATSHSGRKHVMSFRRRGLNGAQPSFRANDRMVKAEDLAKFEVGDPSITGFSAAWVDEDVYRYDIIGIEHPIARALAELPEIVALLQQDVEQYDSLNPIRTADLHPVACRCLRCAVDHKREILARIDGDGCHG